MWLAPAPAADVSALQPASRPQAMIFRARSRPRCHPLGWEDYTASTLRTRNSLKPWFTTLNGTWAALPSRSEFPRTVSVDVEVRIAIAAASSTAIGIRRQLMATLLGRLACTIQTPKTHQLIITFGAEDQAIFGFAVWACPRCARARTCKDTSDANGP
ncbi:hypothetical protein SVAN01_03176 [Stagonosporopsis vannaccii]|nr:hypothetical protein SVAN01_03176 [Stagonosporopsis vannaccii]